MMRVTFALALFLVFAQNAASQALNFGNNFFVTGDYVVAGAQDIDQIPFGGYAIGKINVPDGNPGITGVKSVPQGAQIISALLYWQTIEEPGELGAGQNGFFQPVYKGGPLVGYAVNGVSLGTQTYNAGGCTTGVASGKVLRTYRAEVRGFLPQDAQGNVLANTDSTGFNGYYQVALPSNDDSTPLGATLVIIYRVLSPNFPLNSIVIYDGDFAPSSTSLNMTQTLQVFDVAPSPVSRLTHIVGLGKTNKPETVYLNNTALPSLYPSGEPPFPGYYGTWDNTTWTFDPIETYVKFPNPLNGLVAPSTTTEVVGKTAQQGCVSSVAVIIGTTVDNPDGDGLLRSWKTAGGYCDVSLNANCHQGSNSDPAWVALPGAVPGEKDVFIQLDYMCNSPSGPDRCNVSSANNAFAPPNYSFDPRLEIDPNTGMNAVQEVMQAYANQKIYLHINGHGSADMFVNGQINPDPTIQPVHAMAEPTCTDSPGAKPPELCAFPSQPPYGVPGAVGWKAGFTFIKNQYVDSNGSLLDCAPASASPVASCQARFQHGRKDSWHYVLSGHALGRTTWSLLAKTLVSVVQVGSTVVFTTSTPHGLVPDPNDSGILNGRVSVVSAITNPTLNGTYLVQTVPTPTSFTIHIANPGLGAYSYATDPNLAVASGQSTLASGFSDVGGADSLISLGTWNPVLAQQVVGATLMHELGHSNGLTHGGIFYDNLAKNAHDYRPTVEENCKPNFQSVMSYPFQLYLLNTGSSLALNYSGQALNTLNESSLANGLTTTDGSPLAYPFTIWYTPTKPSVGNPSPTSHHCDGSPTLTGDINPPMYKVEGPANPIGGGSSATPAWLVGGSTDINFDGTVSENDTTLRGYNDWANIDLRQVSSANDTFGGSGSLPPGGGALPPGGGALPPGGGALPPGGGSLPPGGGALPPGGGALPPGGGVAAVEIDQTTAVATTGSPRFETVKEGVSPRTITSNWQAAVGIIGQYNVFLSSNNGGSFGASPHAVVQAGNPPSTMYMYPDSEPCNPAGYAYDVEAVQSSASPNPGAVSPPSNIAPAPGAPLVTGCYTNTPPTVALNNLSFPTNTSYVQGSFVPITWSLQDDDTAAYVGVPTANTSLVAIGPIQPTSAGGPCPALPANPPSPISLLVNGVAGEGNSAFGISGNLFTYNLDTDPLPSGCYFFKLTLDSGQTETTTSALALGIDVNDTDTASPHVATLVLPSGTVGNAYGYQLTEDGGTPSFTWTSTPTLPPGISLSSSGLLSGTSCLANTYSFTAMVTDSKSNSGSQPLSLQINKAYTTTSVTSSANPSVYGQAVTFTATVAPQYGCTPTGTVTFEDGGVPLAGNSTVALSNGMASFTTTTLQLAAGGHSITAVYSGDSNFNATGVGGSTATALSQTVKQATTSTTVMSSLNASTYGQAVTFTATVAPEYAGTPSGQVVFEDNGVALAGSSTVTLLNGMASFTTTSTELVAGSHPITAVYNGDSNFYATGVGGSTATALPQTVNQAPLAITVTGTQVYGGSPSYTITNYAGFFTPPDSPSVITGTLSCTTGVTPSSPVGSYTISSCGGLSAANYSITYSLVAGSFTVTAAPLTVTATGTQVYGGTGITYAPTYSGFVNSEGPSALGGALLCGTNATSTSPVGNSYTTTCGGLSSTNYNITFLPGGFSVTSAPLTATVTGTLVLGGASTYGVAYSGFVNGDTAATAISGSLSGCTTTAPAAVGVYANTISGCLGLTASNYTLTSAFGSFTVLPGLTYGQLSATNYTNPPTSQPGPRCCAAMAYDPVSGSTLLFGGHQTFDNNSYTIQADTWQLKDGQWAQLSPSNSPPARSGAAMVYFPPTNQIVLFGGSDLSTTDFNDTWIWDGSTGTWTPISPTVSGGTLVGRRFDSQGIAYDPNSGSIVMFGGIALNNTTFFNDTWVLQYSGGTWTWTQMSTPANLSARRSVLATDPTGNVVLFGGTGPSGNLGDTWVWNGTTWNQQSPATSPAARDMHNMAFNPNLGVVVLFSGTGCPGGGACNDTWIWNGSSWFQLTPATSAPQRYAFGMDYDASANAIFVFGGFTSGGGAINDTWELAPGTSSYSQLPAPSPGTRCCTGMVFVPQDALGGSNYTLVFGGGNGSGLSDTWAYQSGIWTQLNPATSPSARTGQGMAYDAHNKTVVLFGGNLPGQDLNDTWVWDGSNWTQASPTNIPTGRRWDTQGMAQDPSGNVVMFGGVDAGGNMFGDTWIWDGSNWNPQSPSQSPTARRAPLVYDPGTGNVVLFGGEGSFGGPTFGDTWTWDGSTWTQQNPNTSPAAPLPPPRSMASMAFDGKLGGLILFGGSQAGSGNPDYNDAWKWDGMNWTQLTPVGTPPPARYAFGMVYDPSAGVLMYGGLANQDSTFLNDMWLLAP